MEIKEIAFRTIYSIALDVGILLALYYFIRPFFRRWKKCNHDYQIENLTNGCKDSWLQRKVCKKCGHTLMD